MDYGMKQLLPSWHTNVHPILEEQPPGACFCGIHTLDEDGRIASIRIIDASNEDLGNAIYRAILESDPVPIPAGAECIVGVEVAISVNN